MLCNECLSKQNILRFFRKQIGFIDIIKSQTAPEIEMGDFDILIFEKYMSPVTRVYDVTSVRCIEQIQSNPTS